MRFMRQGGRISQKGKGTWYVDIVDFQTHPHTSAYRCLMNYRYGKLDISLAIRWLLMKTVELVGGHIRGLVLQSGHQVQHVIHC